MISYESAGFFTILIMDPRGKLAGKYLYIYPHNLIYLIEIYCTYSESTIKFNYYYPPIFTFEMEGIPRSLFTLASFTLPRVA